MLTRKLIRTMWNYRAQFLSMVIMIALGIGVFIGFNMEWYSIEKNIDYAFSQTGFSDYRLINKTGFSEDELNNIISIDGVENATRYLSVNTTVKDSKNIITLTVTTNKDVSGFMVISGNDYDKNSTDGIWISDQYANKNNIKLGDNLSLVYKSTEFTGKIKGFIKSGEYLIYIPDESQVMPDFNTSGFAYISPAMLKNTLGYEYYPQINVISNLDKKEFSERANSALGKTTLMLSKDETVSYSEAMGESNEGKTMGAILPVLFLAIAILTMITTMHRITSNEKTQIGTLKALGFKDKTIKWHYTSYALMIGIIGSLLGTIIGYGLAYYIMNPNGAMGTYLDMPKWNLYMPWVCIIIIVLINAFLTFVGYLSVRKMLKGSACETLMPYIPKKVKNLKIEKTRLWNKFSFGTKWNLRDIFRHKARSFMTLVGVFGCVLLIVASFGMKDTADAFIDVFYNKAINYETAINISESATNEEALEICSLYNGDWASKSSVQVEDKTLSVEIYNIQNDYVRFVNDEMQFIELSDDGVFVCQRIAKGYNLKVGDSITFSPYGTNNTYIAKIVDVNNSMSESISMTPNYASKIGLEYKINVIYTQEKDITGSDVVSSTLTKASILKSFDTFMDVMDKMIYLLVVAAVLLGLIVLYNLGVMSYVERYRELATLKVVGFKDKQIGKILISQNLWLTTLGIIIGIPVGIGVLDFLIKALAKEYEMSLCLGPATFIVGIVATLAVSLLVSFLISRKNKKIDMVEALKSAE